MLHFLIYLDDVQVTITAHITLLATRNQSHLSPDVKTVVHDRIKIKPNDCLRIS